MTRHLHMVLFIVASALAGGLGPVVHRAFEHGGGEDPCRVVTACCSSQQAGAASGQGGKPANPTRDEGPEGPCELCAVLATLAASVDGPDEIMERSDECEGRVALFADLVLSVEARVRLVPRGPPSFC